MIKTKLVTIKDIAKECEVNVSTVSRVLNNNTDFPVSEMRKELILSTAKKLKYSPKLSARSLVSGKTFTVGIILGNSEKDLTSTTFSVIMTEIGRTLKKSNYAMAFILLTQGEDLDETIIATLRERRFDAYFIGSSLLKHKTLEEIHNLKLPVVSLLTNERSFIENSKICYIKRNDIPGTKQLCQKLLEFGHKKIGYFTSIFFLEKDTRTKIFTEESQKIGLNFNESNFHTFEQKIIPLTIISQAYFAAKKQLSKLTQYTVIVCSTDLIAFGLNLALEEVGIITGKDISIIGFDNLENNPSYADCSVNLSSIDISLIETGQVVANNLLKSISNKNSFSQIIEIDTKFILRKSLVNLIKQKK